MPVGCSQFPTGHDSPDCPRSIPASGDFGLYDAAVTYRSKPVIGLTGGIGSGKSTVANMLRDLGCVVCDSDALGRAALNDPDIRSNLVNRWGPGILGDDGQIDRSAVGSIVFSDASERRHLESLSHPWIENKRRQQFEAAPADVPAFVIDAPLLLEAGLGKECDAVLFVDAPHAVRLERVQRNRGWDAAELARREQSQWPLDRKRESADYVVVNDTDKDSLAGAVRSILDRIVETSSA